MTKKAITVATAERIRELHKQGRGIQELAREHGVSTTTISRTVRMQLHVPPAVRVVPIIVSRRLHALAALRAAEAGETIEKLLGDAVERALDGGEAAP